MDTRSPTQKGDALEAAVRTIEAAILQTSPSYNDKTFVIETKKRVLIDGVHHEIDIWVKIDLGKGYETLFIFECKNWEDKVGKNEIIVFSRKVHDVRAQHGYFVAKSFTADAEAQAAKDARITLLRATERHFDVPVPFGFHFVLRGHTNAGFMLHERGATRPHPRPLRLEGATATQHGQSIDFREWINAWIEHACNDRLRTFPSGESESGTHKLHGDYERVFEPNELVVNSMEIERATLSVTFEVVVHRPPIVWEFEVERRGRVCRLAPVAVGQDGAIQVDLVGTI